MHDPIRQLWPNLNPLPVATSNPINPQLLTMGDALLKVCVDRAARRMVLVA
jgi:hypothetical protein